MKKKLLILTLTLTSFILAGIAFQQITNKYQGLGYVSFKSPIATELELPYPKSSEPIISGGKIYVVSYVTRGNGLSSGPDQGKYKVLAIDFKTAEIIWEYTLETSSYFNPHLELKDNKVFFFLEESIQALSQEDGSLVWEKSLNLVTWVDHIIIDKCIILSAQWEERLFCVDKDNGEILWEYTSNDNTYDSFLVNLLPTSNRVLIQSKIPGETSISSKKIILNVTDGKTISSFDLNLRITSIAEFENGNIAVAATSLFTTVTEGSISFIVFTNDFSEIVESKKTNALIGGIIYQNEKYIAYDSTLDVYIYDKITGEEKYKVAKGLLSTISLSGKYILIQELDNINLIDIGTEKNIDTKFLAGSTIDKIITYGNLLFFQSEKNITVYSLDSEDVLKSIPVSVSEDGYISELAVSEGYLTYILYEPKKDENPFYMLEGDSKLIYQEIN